MQIIVAIIALGILIVFHELGHFLAAKKFGVYIHEFSIGFGPLLFCKQGEETEFSLRLIPLGGYVRFAGEEGEADDDDLEIPEERLLKSLPPGKRALIMLAGPLMNFPVAALAFFLVLSLVGVATPTTEIAEVLEGYPAYEAGLRAGDKVIMVDDVKITEWQDMVKIVQNRIGVPTVITVERDEQVLSFTVTPIEESGLGIIGVKAEVVMVRFGFFKSIKEAVVETIYVSVAWIATIVGMIRGAIAPELTGPVGITQILGEAARQGIGQLLYLVGFLSANFALFNLLPIPALDGSRLLFTAIEGIRGRPIDPEKENMIHFIGFFLLMILFVVITYKDILRLVG
ncbi:MAG: RIP metalloprotease RseP [Bacillota bacterium]